MHWRISICSQSITMNNITVGKATVGLVTDRAILVSEEETISNLSGNVTTTGFTDAEITSGTVENVTAILSEEETNLTTTMAQSFLNPILSDNIFSRIHLYGLLVVIPLGFILNSLSFIILQKSKTFASSIGNHLKCIAISDNIFLLGFFFYCFDQYWEENINIANFKNLNDWTCKITMTLVTVGFLSTGLILSSSTVERFLAVALPLKYHSWNTLHFSKVVLTIYFLFSFAASSFLLILRKINDRGICDRKEKYDHIYLPLFMITQTVIGNGVCGGLILLFTLLVIGLLFRQGRTRNVLSNKSSSVNSKNDIRITVMLLTVAVLFIVLRLPKIIVLIYIQQTGDPLHLQSLSKFTSLMAAVNHATNFFIYLSFLSSFRQTTLEMFLWPFVKIVECAHFIRIKRKPSDYT